ncbi:MAG: alpha/beta hydrolase [Actinobacteria bacterium]|nr:alpha/beta hydrolase [Actinomycetota bacterium]
MAAAVVFAACSSAGGEGTTSTEEPASPVTTTSTMSTTSTSTPTTKTPPTTTSLQTTTTSPELPDIGAEVKVPDGEGPFPAVVLVHGGGWLAGNPSIMRPLATFLTDQGFLTVNTPYKLSDDSPGFPQAVDDVACAVRYAAAHPDSDGTVALIGHSSGGHISAIVALTGDQYAADCPVPGTGVPDRLVGLAGPYDVSRLGIIMLPFFGAGPNANPDAWLAGNPQRLTDENPDLVSLVMYGGSDGIVDSRFAADFHRALTDSGSESLVEEVENALHNEMRDPAWVGDLIVVWLER